MTSIRQIFPVLVGKSVTGKQKIWHVSVSKHIDGAAITTVWGYEHGKKQTNEKIISAGKYVGKRNETTPIEQAHAEARSIWNKKRDAGYFE